jgi:protein-disulfide isomerase
VKAVVASALSAGEMKRVQGLVDARTLEPLIDRDRQLGESVPVRATPTIVIHTRHGQVIPVVGPVSYEDLKDLLDQLISENTTPKSR